jgi:hypothetical protein
MTPLSTFHDGLYSNYKNFIKTEYKTTIYDTNQPLLKCKLAGVGKGRKQLNYLSEKVAKEDQYPVYLVPELCFVLPIPASSLVQLKFLPSLLHRLHRLLLAREILDDLVGSFGWRGAGKCIGKNPEGDEDLDRLSAEQEERKRLDEERREEVRKRFKKDPKPIPEKQHIENRELHYEFIHPNKITPKHVKLFHEAVSNQHAAKKLVPAHDAQAEMANDDLSRESKIGKYLRLRKMADGITAIFR